MSILALPMLTMGSIVAHAGFEVGPVPACATKLSTGPRGIQTDAMPAKLGDHRKTRVGRNAC